MTTTSGVLLAVAEHLHTTGVGTWSPTGVFPTGATAITHKTMPTAPDRALVLTVYDIHDTPNPGDRVRTYSLQVRTRGLPLPPTDVDDLAEAARDALTVHGAQWGGLQVHRCYRTSTAPLGADENRRQERTDNYRLTTHR